MIHDDDGDPIEPMRSARLNAVSAAPLDPRSLVGSFFLSDAGRGWQGCVVAEPSPGVYLVELFSWVMGESTEQKLIRLDDMDGWHFYDDDKWMRNSYEHGISAAWERERAKDGSLA